MTKYKRWYDNIINKALNENRAKGNVYYERHHIVPKCLSGTNKSDNLVLLTAKEHFICHWLLVKCLPEERKMKYAFWKMVQVSERQKRKITSKQYEIAKKQYSLVARFPVHATRKGKKHYPESIEKMSRIKLGKIPWNKGKTGIYSEATKQKISETKKGIPSWNKGKNLSEQHKIKNGLSHRKNYKLTSPEGEVFHIHGIYRFAGQNKLHATALIRVAKNKQNQHKGWQCEYLTRTDNENF